MKIEYSVFMAFFIPLSLAVMLYALESHFFYSPALIDNFGSPQFGIGLVNDYSAPILPNPRMIYEYFIGGLFLLSIILPLFVNSRSEPMESGALKLNDN